MVYFVNSDPFASEYPELTFGLDNHTVANQQTKRKRQRFPSQCPSQDSQIDRGD